MLINGAKVRYSESEAASRLGLPVEQLRALVRTHIAAGEEVPANATYEAADIVILRILASGQRNPTVL